MNTPPPWYFISCLAIFFFSFAFSGWALEKFPTGEPFTIEANSISYDQGEDVYRASGQVSIAFSGGTLEADFVLLAKGSNIASAEGRVKVEGRKAVILPPLAESAPRIRRALTSRDQLFDTGKIRYDPVADVGRDDEIGLFHLTAIRFCHHDRHDLIGDLPRRDPARRRVARL